MKILENFSSGLDAKKKLLLVAIGIVILVYADISLLISRQLRCNANLAKKISQIRQELSVVNTDMARMQNFKGKVDQNKVALKKFEIISEGRLPELLENISGMANKNKVKVMQMRPVKDPKANTELLAGLKVNPVTITLELACGYHSLGSFINTLENSGQFISVQSLRISPVSGDYTHESINLVLKTYVK